MAQEGANSTAAQPLWRDWFSFGFYKRTQGRYARWGTFFALALSVAYGSLSLFNFLIEAPNQWRYAAPLGVLAVGWWLSFRLIQWPRFAEFLIGVEGEMNKVSWPGKDELKRSVVVVLITLFGMSAVIFVFDVIWQSLLSQLGILGPGGG